MRERYPSSSPQGSCPKGLRTSARQGARGEGEGRAEGGGRTSDPQAACLHCYLSQPALLLRGPLCLLCLSANGGRWLASAAPSVPLFPPFHRRFGDTVGTAPYACDTHVLDRPYRDLFLLTAAHHHYSPSYSFIVGLRILWQDIEAKRMDYCIAASLVCCLVECFEFLFCCTSGYTLRESKCVPSVGEMEGASEVESAYRGDGSIRPAGEPSARAQ